MWRCLITIAARAKLSDEGLTVVAKELKGVNLATKFSKKASNCLDIPKDKIKAALIIKNASKKPIGFNFDDSEEDEQLKAIINNLPKNYYLESLKEIVPKTITIAFDEEIDGVTKIEFPFIKEEPREKLARGVSIASDVNFDDLEDLDNSKT